MKVLAVLGVVGALVLSVLLAALSFRNTSNRFENGIQAAYTNNQNVYDNGWKEVKEKAQIPTMAEAQLEKLYKATLEGRYGDKGSQAVAQFIHEQNPNIDPQIYLQIQQSIEGFRRTFTSHQTVLISQKQAYQNYLTGTLVGVAFNGYFAYPHIDMTKYDIVTSDRTQDDFNAKKSEPLDLLKQ